jgi:hypothetical protein
MAITLGGINLPDLIIEDEFAFAGVRSIVNRALDGTPIVWEQEMAGKPIDLVGRSDTAWITRQVLSNILNLASVINAEYELDYEGNISNVRFRHEEEPVISAVPVVERPNVSSSDWYSNVKIKLMEV